MKSLNLRRKLTKHFGKVSFVMADFNMDIHYTPGKANVMADALSRKAYCSELEVQVHQPVLYEELRRLNLEIVPQGHVNSLVIEPDLVKSVKIMRVMMILYTGLSAISQMEDPHPSLLITKVQRSSRIAW